MSSKRSKAQKAHISQLAASIKSAKAAADVHPKDSPSTLSAKPKTRKQAHEATLNGRIQELETELTESRALANQLTERLAVSSSEVATARTEIGRLEAHILGASIELGTTGERLLALEISVASLTVNLKKANKRAKRLAREKADAQRRHTIRTGRLELEKNELVQDLSRELVEANLKAERLASVTAELETTLTEEKAVTAGLRKKNHTVDMRNRRARSSLSYYRRRLSTLATWKAAQKGTYTPEARRLFRALSKAGCAGDRVCDAIKACARAFGIAVLRLPSRRTVHRARDEGGMFADVQTGREISQCEGFGASSDGTTNRKITFESNHITLQCPTYTPGVDDSDRSTWTSQTRFVKVEPAIDHKAQTQFEGTKKLAEQIASAYSNSPLAERDGAKMEADDWFRKQEFQNMDHASDGKKKLNLCAEYKKDVIAGDLGREALKALETGEFVKSLAALTKDDVEKAYRQAKFEVENESDLDRATVTKLIEKIVGQTVLDSMSDHDREVLLAITFAGCCAHKDMNAFKYGTTKLERGWEERNKTPPVLLANKANAATIRLGNADSAAVQQAIDSSSRGGVKLVSLAAALFNHSDDKRGYQEMHRVFMKDEKLAFHGIKDESRFPDANNTRFNSHTKGACELITYLDSYFRLIESCRDSKASPGFNHVEATLYKGLQDISTITELAAESLYGISVSWLYMAMVRGKKGEVRNLLDQDLIDLHRRLPDFCDAIAANPDLLLEESISDFSNVTLDGKPWSHPNTVLAIRVLKDELPDLKGAISDMFSGAAEGWRQFTQEFAPGGALDSLTPEQRARIFIPATNDANEGALGSWRVWLRYHPSSTAAGFSNKIRLERNNTESFIEKHCNEADHKYVMRTVRARGASGENSRFHQELLEAQRERIRAYRQKQQDAETKKQREKERLIAVGIVMDVAKIMKMKASELDDQLKIHSKILNDETLSRTRQKDIRLKADKLTALLAAVERNRP
ncbi:hypothetical protein CVT26_012756 [Gymnopilus dilepis]|uniref:Uncharacterized protein n=1 Tax=Gymnopilus dilepis TaxID=231916 RepID=A0A409X0G1_9AGAR|nr:hypothetical protein CVT26_012756 [Gymnopilus dilepis]